MSLPTQYRRNDPYEALTRDFDQFVSRVFGGDEVPASLAPFGVDIHEDAEHLYIEAELPGFTKDQIDVTIDKQVMTISADRSESNERPTENNKGWLLRERRFHRFQRAFTLPDTVDASNINAKLDNGILMLTLNKKPESKPRKVSIG